MIAIILIVLAICCSGVNPVSFAKVNGGVGDDAGKQAPTPVKKYYKQEADCNGKDNLAKIFYQITFSFASALKRRPLKITSSTNPT